MPDPLNDAIALLEGYRHRLGDAAVDAAIDALRQHATRAPDRAAQRLRQVSVLFADVAESTAMLAKVGPQDASDLLDRALRGFADSVHRWGGRVLRYTGDGVKAAFGVDGLREDEAERAVRAGLQILHEAHLHARRVKQELGVDGFGVRVGIHTGDVLLGGGVETDRSAMGHAVHLAARMEQSAPVGALRISDDTWQQVRGLFTAEAQPPLSVKGHDAPLNTWLVTGTVAGADSQARRGLDIQDSPMVGRDAELAALLALPREAAARGGLAGALVLGDAGIGKTRLRHELLHHLARAPDGPDVLLARAQPATRLQPHGLLRRLLDRWLGLHDELSPEAARQRLLQALAPWLGPQTALLAPRIGQLLGLDFSTDPAVRMLQPAMLRQQAHDALRQALAACCARRTVVLVLDDLHWADDDSLAWVRRLVAQPVGPLALVLLARPALLERAADWPGGPEAAWRTLTLQALGAQDGAALLDSLLAPLPGLPPDLRAGLLERAGGNPFFLEALVRMLIDDGVIDVRTRPWRLHPQRQARLRVPSTLVGVLQASLDALPAPARRGLQMASVIGPVFWDAALAELDAAAPAALPILQQRGMVLARTGSAFLGTTEHGFGHHLLHETVYATVLKPQRRAAHARAAQWLADRLQGRGGDDHAVVAEHWDRAGDSVRALHCWDLAAADAARRGASATALQFLERALSQPALTDPAWRATLLIERRQTLDRTGQPEAAAAALAALADHAEAVDCDAVRAHVAVARMLQADAAGRRDDARQLAQRALELAAAAGRPLARAAAARAEGELAWLAVTRDDFEATARHLEAGMRHARAAATLPRREGGDADVQHALQVIGIESLVLQERYLEALHAARALQAELRAADAPAYPRLNAASREVTALRRLGDLAAAATCCDEALALARDAGIARLERVILGLRIELALAQRHAGMAATLLQAHRPLALRLDDAIGLAADHELQAQWHQQRGELEAAWAALSAADEGFAAMSHRHSTLQVRAARAEMAWLTGRHAEAKQLVDDVLAQAQADARPHRRLLLPDALVQCCLVLQALGDPRGDALRDDLQARLQLQLDQLPDATMRQQLLQGEPMWRAAGDLLGERTT